MYSAQPDYIQPNELNDALNLDPLAAQTFNLQGAQKTVQTTQHGVNLDAFQYEPSHTQTNVQSEVSHTQTFAQNDPSRMMTQPSHTMVQSSQSFVQPTQTFVQQDSSRQPGVSQTLARPTQIFVQPT